MSRRMLMAVALTASLVLPATMAHAGEPLDAGTYVMRLDGDVRVVLTVGPDGSVDVDAPENVNLLLERDADDRILDEFEVVVAGNAFAVDFDVNLDGSYDYVAVPLDVTVPVGSETVVIAGPGEASAIATAKAKATRGGKQMAIGVRAKAAAARTQALGVAADEATDVVTLALIGERGTTTSAAASTVARTTKPKSTAEAREAAAEARAQVKEDRQQVKDDIQPAQEEREPSVDEASEASVVEVSEASEPSVDEATVTVAPATPTLEVDDLASTVDAELQDSVSLDQDQDQDEDEDDVPAVTKPEKKADVTSSPTTQAPKAAVTKKDTVDATPVADAKAPAQGVEARVKPSLEKAAKATDAPAKGKKD